MPSCNHSIHQPLLFTLAGIPGLESSHGWFSVPFFLIFVVTIIGNVTILNIIWKEKSLHEPMFILLATLSVVDLCLVKISFDACLTQIFFIPSFYVMESGILLAMAFDRFVAICYPLRYTTILDGNILVKMALAILVRAVAVIAYSYCAYMAVVMIACGDITNHIVYGLLVIVASVGVDLVFYTLHLHAVFHISSWQARSKVLSTCGSHLCVIGLFYSPVVFSVLSQILGYHIAPYLQIIIDNLYFLVPPMVNPLIYAATKQMCEWVFQALKYYRD
ncbi:Olfr600 [Phodopus roborovskii]|uniref:Olfr600 protein n=1 Tax=Phodopus roborovskii TaxID=109678 RepID=A0AAU9ZJB1_PHORO|nr:Olfr600 [Phodopus roborovskii]